MKITAYFLKYGFGVLLFVSTQVALSNSEGVVDLPDSMVELSEHQLESFAREGDKEAQFRLGLFYESKSDHIEKYRKSAYWYELASRQGHPVAKYNLGVLHMTGKGVEKSVTKSLELWLAAARENHVHAQFNVARGYFLGIGLEENHEKAKYWLQRAAKQGEPKSKDLLEQLGWSEQSEVSQSKENLKSLAPVKPKVNIKTPIKAKDQETKKNKLTKLKQQASLKTGEVIDIYVSPTLGSDILVSLPNKSGITVYKSDKQGWLIVEKASGFNAWVYKNFLKVEGGVGTITGKAVIARSKPKILEKTKFNVFKQEQIVQVIKREGDWYQVTLPPKFKAWVKELDW